MICFNRMMQLGFAAVVATLVFGSQHAAQAAVTVPVGNYSFETAGTQQGTSQWFTLPSPGAWADGKGSTPYEIYDASISNANSDLAAGRWGRSTC